MSDLVRDTLLEQHRIASALLHFHLDSLETPECLWRPASCGLHVYRNDIGEWIADWPDHEGYDLGPPSIAWTTWHIGFWWSMVLDHSFGSRSLTREAITWPGTAEAARAWISNLETQWYSAVADLSDAQLASQSRTRWPFTERPFAEVVSWANIELAKNAAEIGLLRFLYAVRKQTASEEGPSG